MGPTDLSADILVFDLDGTLVQLDFTKSGMEKVRADLQSVFSEAGVSRDFKPLLAELDETLNELSAQLEQHAVDDLRRRAFEKIATMERDAVSRQHVYPAARPLLEKLGQSTTQVAVATNNTRAAATESIRLAGFPEPDYLVALDDVGKPKPNPDMIELLFAKFDQSPESISMVGDRLSDAESMHHACEDKEARATTILLDRENREDQNAPIIDYNIESLTEMSDLI